jgi:hypothetical protein
MVWAEPPFGKSCIGERGTLLAETSQDRVVNSKVEDQKGLPERSGSPDKQGISANL